MDQETEPARDADPAADLLPFLCAHNARARLISKTSRRTLPVEELVTGPGATVVGPDELLAALIVPTWSPSVSFWRKAGTRRANALTKVSLFACADTDGVTVHRARISLGAVAPTVLRLRDGPPAPVRATHEEVAPVQPPAAAHLANGAPLAVLGAPAGNLVRFPVPSAVRLPDGQVQGQRPAAVLALVAVEVEPANEQGRAERAFVGSGPLEERAVIYRIVGAEPDR